MENRPEQDGVRKSLAHRICDWIHLAVRLRAQCELPFVFLDAEADTDLPGNNGCLPPRRPDARCGGKKME